LTEGRSNAKAEDGFWAGVILAYLNEKNRPYSAQDVFSNLQKQHGLGKTAVVKAMELLALEGKIKEKIYGKQKIYFADQSLLPNVGPATWMLGIELATPAPKVCNLTTTLSSCLYIFFFFF
uniref:Homologous-pairing protein 2 homolog n=1 Tax=Pundamilia nyererei TaxID=303518 RepID=A0A3B4FTB4_9CICH